MNSKTNIPFKTETQQLLEILIHSLYNEREVFLRELISNASDALSRMNFEMLTNRNVLDADANLEIRISVDSEAKTLIIRDTGIGMTEEELIENLGTIAQSGARNFLNAMENNETQNISDIIGHFGVGFYSAFMAAESIRVTSRSYNPDAKAAAWISDGKETFSIEPAEKEDRGTEVVVKLIGEAEEFAEESRVCEVIQKHSNYIPFPIYIGDSEEQVNQQTTLWRQQPHTVDKEEYEKFYKQFSMNWEAPITQTHINVDAPIQMYALLYVPNSPEKNIFSTRNQEGLKLFARKVLIQEYSTELLPKCLRFIDGVVDSEDLPLNVSRESVQSTQVIGQLKKLITSKAIDMLMKLGKDSPEKYEEFWNNFGRFLKEGIATDFDQIEKLLPLLRFPTLKSSEKLLSLEEYTAGMKEGQDKIYYILGDDNKSALNSPHLDIFKHLDYDVFLFTDPIDSFMLMRFKKFEDFELINVTKADLKLPETSEEEEKTPQDQITDEEKEDLIDMIKKVLGERVSDVRVSDQLVESPARLVDPEGTLSPEMQRVYHLLEKDFELPQKVLEINSKNPIIQHLRSLKDDDPKTEDIIEQIFENALLIEGLHPNPASMIQRIQRLMMEALK